MQTGHWPGKFIQIFSHFNIGPGRWKSEIHHGQVDYILLFKKEKKPAAPPSGGGGEGAFSSSQRSASYVPRHVPSNLNVKTAKIYQTRWAKWQTQCKSILQQRSRQQQRNGPRNGRSRRNGGGAGGEGSNGGNGTAGRSRGKSEKATAAEGGREEERREPFIEEMEEGGGKKAKEERTSWPLSRHAQQAWHLLPECSCSFCQGEKAWTDKEEVIMTDDNREKEEEREKSKLPPPWDKLKLLNEGEEEGETDSGYTWIYINYQGAFYHYDARRHHRSCRKYFSGSADNELSPCGNSPPPALERCWLDEVMRTKTDPRNSRDDKLLHTLRTSLHGEIYCYLQNQSSSNTKGGISRYYLDVWPCDFFCTRSFKPFSSEKTFQSVHDWLSTLSPDEASVLKSPPRNFDLKECLQLVREGKWQGWAAIRYGRLGIQPAHPPLVHKLGKLTPEQLSQPQRKALLEKCSASEATTFGTAEKNKFPRLSAAELEEKEIKQDVKLSRYLKARPSHLVMSSVLPAEGYYSLETLDYLINTYKFQVSV